MLLFTVTREEEKERRNGRDKRQEGMEKGGEEKKLKVEREICERRGERREMEGSEEEKRRRIKGEKEERDGGRRGTEYKN